MIEGMDHVGISVANLDRAIDFYQHILEMKKVSGGTFAGGQYETIMRLPGATGRSATLAAEGMKIELFEFHNPMPAPSNPLRPVCDHGITHICIRVKDINHEYEKMRAAGMVFHSAPLLFGSTRAAYGRDPDGNVLELIERSS
jgi:glyoxylase I family protein